MNIDPEELYSLLFEMSPKPSEVFPFTAYLGQVHDPDVLLTPIMTDLGKPLTHFCIWESHYF